MVSPRFLTRLMASLGLLAVTLTPALADTTLLNVSYDVSRELYKDINPAFIAQWQARHKERLSINQSHGGSSKQAGAVIGGLEADVVTMNQAPDIDILVERGGLVAPDWRKKFPHEATPYRSISVFLVRKGNPKGIKDWSDLARPGVAVIVPNPKTSGNGRYTWLAAWGYALRQNKGDEARAREFLGKLFANVPVLDGGGRGATTTFTQRGVGDVLVTFENEAVLIDKEVGGGQFDVVYPSVTIEAPAPVAVVDKVVDKKGSREAATAYLNFLFSPEGQEIIAKHHFRPRDAAVLKKYAARFPAVPTFTVESALGGWAKVQKLHFADGGLYDQIVAKR
ncbi:MAG: sulfate ABC transporter substrate-binding protein [Azovibrio sp.]|uniref:sulfate ABC transporter substrate-binding protein n=1 Tax=Azovibrio sp. TaxID=1872673 RepID=UPI003C709AA1